MIKNHYTLLSIILFTMLTVSCGGGGGDNESNDITEAPQPGSFPATSNIFTDDTYTDAEVSVDANDQSIIRTKLAILFNPTATKTEVDTLLARINATITASIAGARSVSVRIPDPGDVAALEAVISDIESEPFVDAVLKSIVVQPEGLPDNVSEENPDDLRIIDNQLAVGGHAAWNAKEAIISAPNIIIMDWFGYGVSQLKSFLDYTTSASVWNFAPDADDHGYHVAGILNGSYGGGSSTAALVTGMMPGPINLSTIDLSNKMSDHDSNVRALLNASTMSGTVILNTSLSKDCVNPAPLSGTCIDTLDMMNNAIMWADLVRSANVESKLFHATAAGNRETPRYDARDAETSHDYTTAALMTMSTADGDHVPTLTNTVVVENLYGSDYPSEDPREVKCLSENSFVGGHISAIGSDVTSLSSIGTAIFSGTSMATPQVAGLAAYLYAIDPTLSPQKIKEILLNTSQAVPTTGGFNCSDWATPAPSIDAYAAVLALDKSSALNGTRSHAPVRNAILDIVDQNPAELGSNGQFDENDLLYYIEQISVGSLEKIDGIKKVKYSRADLNGDGYDGGDDGFQKKFNLDIDYPPSFTTVTQIIEDREVEFDENSLTDNEILCYYAYSSLYTGSTAERKTLMSDRCVSGIVAVYYSHGNSISFDGPSCSNTPVPFVDETRETVSKIEDFEDNFNNRPESHYWHSGDIDIERAIYEEVGTSGFADNNGSCTDYTFYGYSKLDSTIDHAIDSSRINIDITATAAAECKDITDSELWECSDADAVTLWMAQYDYKIKAATKLKMVINLACTGPNLSPPGYPDPTNPLIFPPNDLFISVTRLNAAGEAIAQHDDHTKIYIPQHYYCNDDTPMIDVEELIEFSAPETEGSTDLAVIWITGSSGSVGNFGNGADIGPISIPVPRSGELGVQTNESTMFGYVEVLPTN